MKSYSSKATLHLAIVSHATPSKQVLMFGKCSASFDGMLYLKPNDVNLQILEQNEQDRHKARVQAISFIKLVIN